MLERADVQAALKNVTKVEGWSMNSSDDAEVIIYHGTPTMPANGGRVVLKEFLITGEQNWNHEYRVELRL